MNRLFSVCRTHLLWGFAAENADLTPLLTCPALQVES